MRLAWAMPKFELPPKPSGKQIREQASKIGGRARSLAERALNAADQRVVHPRVPLF